MLLILLLVVLEERGGGGGYINARILSLFVYQQNAHSNYGVTVFSKEELSHYDSESEKTYVAVMGRVFDVSSGKYYKKDGGYGFFAGRDASRAYVTGDFEEVSGWNACVYG